jgi:hypothetical protein
MAKIACCYNCVFAFLDPEHTLECYEAGLVSWPACANHPDAYGRMRRTPERGICPNYRPRPPVPQGESVRTIPLGDGFVAYVDAADFEWLSQWTWHWRGGYAARTEKGRVVYMHRQIMQPPQGKIVDHKNRNKLDNTRENLRSATYAENMRNRDKQRGTTSRFKGVSYCKRREKWLATILVKRKARLLGFFVEEVEAARAYDRAAVESYGEFARLNFPEEWPPQRRAKVYAQRDTAQEEGKRKRARGRAPRRKTHVAEHKPKPGRATRQKTPTTRARQATRGKGRVGAKARRKRP